MRKTGDTWVADMRHYLDEEGCLGDMPTPALNLALHFGAIVAWMTSHLPVKAEPTNVVCRRRPGRRRCRGEIYAGFGMDLQAIEWYCPECGDNGLIYGWEGSPWDRGVWHGEPVAPGITRA